MKNKTNKIIEELREALERAQGEVAHLEERIKEEGAELYPEDSVHPDEIIDEDHFWFNGKEYNAHKAVKPGDCLGCAFLKESGACSFIGIKSLIKKKPSCIQSERKDDSDIIFIEVEHGRRT